MFSICEQEDEGKRNKVERGSKVLEVEKMSVAGNDNAKLEAKEQR